MGTGGTGQCLPDSGVPACFGRYGAMLEMRRALKDMVRTARRYSRRTAAAIKIQVQRLAR